MCTLTFVPNGDQFIFTSSRDEKSVRPGARPPAFVESPTGRIMYPQDRQAGGSWLVVREQGDVLVLLNGALQKHVPDPPYIRSRGLVVLDLAQSSYPMQTFGQIDLSGIEPFTLVYFEAANHHLYSLRWTGKTKLFCQELTTQHRIWSSATLYPPSVVREREAYFLSWLRQTHQVNQQALINFHTDKVAGNRSVDILQNRHNGLKTLSITSLVVSPACIDTAYYDLTNASVWISQVKTII